MNFKLGRNLLFLNPSLGSPCCTVRKVFAIALHFNLGGPPTIVNQAARISLIVLIFTGVFGAIRSVAANATRIRTLRTFAARWLATGPWP